MDIRIISLDVPYMADVVLPLPPLKLATSVDVDRKTGEIYWTDTAEDTIQKTSPDGKIVEVIIMHEMEAPDGIAIDSTGRKVSDIKNVFISQTVNSEILLFDRSIGQTGREIA